jgi:hypothetical protein
MISKGNCRAGCNVSLPVPEGLVEVDLLRYVSESDSVVVGKRSVNVEAAREASVLF